MEEKKPQPANLKGRNDLADLNRLAADAMRDGFATGKIWLEGPQRYATALAMKVEHEFIEVYTAEDPECPPEKSKATPEEVQGRALSSILDNRYSSRPRLCTISPSGELFDARVADGFLPSINPEATVPRVSLVNHGLELLADAIKEGYDQALYEAAMSHPKAEAWREEAYLTLRDRPEKTFSALFHGELYTTIPEVPIDVDFLMPGSLYPHVLLGLDERTLAMRAIESPTLTAQDAVDDILESEVVLTKLGWQIAFETARQQLLAEALRDRTLLEEVARAQAMTFALESFRGNVNIWVEVPTRGDGLRFRMPVEDLRRAMRTGVLDPMYVIGTEAHYAALDAERTGGDIRIGEISSLTYSRKTYWEGKPLYRHPSAKEEPDDASRDDSLDTRCADARVSSDAREISNAPGTDTERRQEEQL